MDSGISAAVESAKALPPDLPRKTKLRLYALYKQSVIGDAPKVSPAGRFDAAGQLKFAAWAEARGMTQLDAKRRYVEQVRCGKEGVPCDEEAAMDAGAQAGAGPEAPVTTSATSATPVAPAAPAALAPRAQPDEADEVMRIDLSRAATEDFATAANVASPMSRSTMDGTPFHRRGHCEVCHAKFIVYGRHHCRRCGLSVCHDHFVRPYCTPCHRNLTRPLPGSTDGTSETLEAAAKKARHHSLEACAGAGASSGAASDQASCRGGPRSAAAPAAPPPVIPRREIPTKPTAAPGVSRLAYPRPGLLHGVALVPLTVCGVLASMLVAIGEPVAALVMLGSWLPGWWMGRAKSIAG